MHYFQKIDKAELDSLAQIYCKERKSPLLVGSIIPQTGNSEATSVLFSLVKLLVAMQEDTIPATLNFEIPNPDINSLQNGNLEVVTENRKWTATYAAVNAVEIQNYYGHMIIKRNELLPPNYCHNLPTLVFASARTEIGMQQVLESVSTYQKYLCFCLIYSFTFFSIHVIL